MKRWKKRSPWALALALTLAVLLLAVPKAYGAGGIDTGKACTINFKLDGQYQELDNLPIPVKLYQTASVDETGRYTSAENFSSLNFSQTGSETSAEYWEKLAEEAAAVVKSTQPPHTAQTIIQKQPGQESASGIIQNLVPGIYLVMAEPVQTAEYQYSFIPYLAALPNNFYTENGDDQWIYEIESTLKPEQKERFGSLVIEKELSAYKASPNGASFQFEVKAEKDGKIVFSEVVSLTFSAPGVKSLTIADRIPAGSVVTVTELLTGSSTGYTIVSDKTQTVTISADEGENPALVHFENTWKPRPGSSSSIVNHFRYQDGVWEVIQETDSTQNQ